MALLDVIKYEISGGDLVYKYPSDELKFGSQLIVGVSQVAFLVKGGSIVKELGTGTYTIKGDNFPLVGSVVNLPFGGESPFKCEVWFVSLLPKMDLKWGTISPIQFRDRKYDIIIPIRAYGQYGIKVSNPLAFFQSLVGNNASFTPEKLNEYFKGRILQEFTVALTKDINDRNSSIFDILVYVSSLSEAIGKSISISMKAFGIDIVNFDIISLNVPEDDQSFRKLKEAQAIAAKLNILGQDMYRIDRGLDVLEKAAEQEGNSVSALINTGIGLGAGIGLANQLLPISNQSLGNIAPNNLGSLFFFFQKGTQMGPFTREQVVEQIKLGKIDSNCFLWKNGYSDWIKASDDPEFISIKTNAGNLTPPPFKF